MLQVFWNVLRSRKSNRRPDPSWRCDPLAHPVLDRMTPTELGDLPVGNARYDCGR
ncbi:MAG: hypothetical protein JJ913_12705 [Rhizobiaceae bacterium]|nr:hypothetical protein [Rhizobiaceae bacterium]